MQCFGLVSRPRRLPSKAIKVSAQHVRDWSYASSQERGTARDTVSSSETPHAPPVSTVSDTIHNTLRDSRFERLRNAPPFSSFLTDTFNRQHSYLRISITERCNLRCTYCMPEAGVPLSPENDNLTTPEILLLSELFVSQGVNKIRLTGGEPTIRKDILSLMQRLGDLRSKGLKELALTTNGVALWRKLDAMAEAGLTGVNLSLDTLDPHLFQIITRRKGFQAVIKSMDRIQELNKLGAGIKLKINCVVTRGVNDSEILDFVDLGKEKDIEIRFIEYMPFDGNKWEKKKMFSYEEMLQVIRSRYPDFHRLHDKAGETSKTWKIPGFVGKVGFITSMTENFCGTCNRLRITSDGNLKVCLFGNSEVSLRDLLREGTGGDPVDESAYAAMREIEGSSHIGPDGFPTFLKDPTRERQLLDVIGQAVGRKKARHAGMDNLSTMPNRPMILIDDLQLSFQKAMQEHAIEACEYGKVYKPAVKSAWSTHSPRLSAPFTQKRSFGHTTACAATTPTIENVDMSDLKRQLEEFRGGNVPSRYKRLAATQLVEKRENVGRTVAEATDVLFSEAKFSRAQACDSIKAPLEKSEGIKDFLTGMLGGIKDKLTMWTWQRIPKIDPTVPAKTNNTDREALDRVLHNFLMQPDNLDRLLIKLPSRALWRPESLGVLLPGDIRSLKLPSADDDHDESSRSSRGQGKSSIVSENTDSSQRKMGRKVEQGKSLIRFHTDDTAKKSRLSTDRPETSRTLSAPSTTSTSNSAPALPHLTAASTVHMVSVNDKPITTRQAIAYAVVRFSKREPLNAILQNQVVKGDVLAVSRIAGIMGAKKTADIVPLCHPGLQITHVEVDVEAVDSDSHPTKQVREGQKSKLKQDLPDGMTAESQEAELWIAKRMFMNQGVGPFGGVKICATVACSGKTGVEMEALTAATTAALSVVDMCKALDKGMEIFAAKVVYKDGGRSGTYRDEDWGT